MVQCSAASELKGHSRRRSVAQEKMVIGSAWQNAVKHLVVEKMQSGDMTSKTKEGLQWFEEEWIEDERDWSLP